MHFKFLDKKNETQVVALFTESFSSSEGEEEGKVIASLVSKLVRKAENEEIIGLGTYKNESLVGAIFFTRLSLQEPVLIYMLSPVAVSSQHQGKGVGQALINFGINELKSRSVAVLVTYGDPAFYSKVGFQSLSERFLPAPLKLSMPEGWLGQSLTNKPIPTINERPNCVEEFNEPDLW